MTNMNIDKSKISIRAARPEDASDLLEIYRPYIEKTAITFEYDVPSVEEFRNRIIRITKKYPYIVAEYDGTILGYAYTHEFYGRAAYDWSVETTVYIGMEYRKMGIGKLLYEEIEKISRRQNILNLYACISFPDVDDEYLTRNSIEFHEHMGYRFIGEFRKCGYKFDRWYNMAWMEKMLGEHTASNPKVIPVNELS